MVYYQWEKYITDSRPKKMLSSWNPDFGPVVLERKEGKATKVCFNVLIDNPKVEIILAGPFNDWGKKNCDEFIFKHDKHNNFASIITDKIKHNEPYKLVVNGEFRQDPAGVYFSDTGDTIFWDFDDPSTYKKKFGFIDTVHRPTKIIQTDLPGLISHWADEKGICGREIERINYYSFIKRSGILEHIKELGFNTIQFLPFAQSIDGDNWKFRYLVPFHYSIQKNWGTPDEFMAMIDKCHELGIAVIGDFIVSHLPFKDFKVFGFDCKHNGLHIWMNRHGYQLFMKEETHWGTMRPDYDNPFVRDFFIQSCLTFMKHYSIDGFRIDNVDGIIRYGPHGEGDERPNGRTFLRQLNKAIYDYNPYALIHFESHYFHGDNAKMLVVPFETDQRALGATAYSGSRLTHYFHKDFMLNDVKKISPWKFKDIAEEQEWGQSNSTVADFHNHDAAAGLMPERATGSYAYDAMIHENPHNHIHALGKIKVMEAIISFCCEGRTLDLVQTFLLQKGTFEHDSSIQWYLTFNQVSRNNIAFKKFVNNIMEDPAFWPLFAHKRKYLNIDDTNKVIVVERSSDYKGKKSKFVVVINLSSWVHHKYKVGVIGKEDYEPVMNSDLFDYAGFGMVSFPLRLENRSSKNFEVLDREIELPMLAPYGIAVLRAIQ